MNKLCLSILFFLGTVAFVTWNLFLSPLLVPWRVDYDSALKLAQSEHRPILIFLSHLETCDHCQNEFSKQLNTLEFKRFANHRMILVMEDADDVAHSADKQNARLRRYFGIQSCPGLLLIDGNQKELWRHEGYNADLNLQVELRPYVGGP